MSSYWMTEGERGVNRKLKYESVGWTCRKTVYGMMMTDILKSDIQASGWCYCLRVRKDLDPGLRPQTGYPGSIFGGEGVCPVPPGKCRDNVSH